MKLSPTTSYYIRKLLQQMPDEDKDTALKPGSSSYALSDLGDVLQSLYPSATEISVVVQRLENLVCLHKSIQAQTSLYANYVDELTKLEQQIFRLLGFQKASV